MSYCRLFSENNVTACLRVRVTWTRKLSEMNESANGRCCYSTSRPGKDIRQSCERSTERQDKRPPWVTKISGDSPKVLRTKETAKDLPSAIGETVCSCLHKLSHSLQWVHRMLAVSGGLKCAKDRISWMLVYFLALFGKSRNTRQKRKHVHS